MKKTILFDLDGTLIDSTEAILDGFHNSFKELSFKAVIDENIVKLIGHPLDFMYAHLGVEESRVWDFVDVYKKHYRKIAKQKTTMLPNAKEAIIEASKFARLAIVTTKTGRYSKELLEHMDYMKYFEVLIGREHVTDPKPHPEPILKAIHQLNVNRESCWMIGDTCLDIVSANRANIQSVGVTSGYASKQELQRCGKYVKEDSLEAVRFIQKHI